MGDKEYIPETNTHLGFGDHRGSYDFDTMTMNLDAVLEGEGSEFRQPMNFIEAHETTHWHQQITTTYGNFSTLVRWKILDVSHQIWIRLKSDATDQINLGTLNAPFTDALNGGIYEHQLLSDLDTNAKENVDSNLESIKTYKTADLALSTTKWIKNKSLHRKYSNAIASVFVDIRCRGSKNKSEEARAEEINAYSEILFSELTNFESLNDIRDMELWDIDSLLEASSVAQEFVSVLGDKEVDYAYLHSRLEQVKKTSYFGPIRQILFVCNLQHSVLSLISCAGLIISIIEVAINPPIPPREEVNSQHSPLAEIHPSIRFAKIAMSFAGRIIDLNGYASIKKIDVSQRAKIGDQYLTQCNTIAVDASVAFSHRLKPSFLYGQDTFAECARNLQQLLLTIDTEQELLDSQSFDGLHAYPWLAEFILDCGYNNLFLGGVLMQNMGLLHKSVHERFSTIGWNRAKFIRENFMDYIAFGISYVPLQYIWNDEQRFSRFLEDYSELFLLLPQSYLHNYYQLFVGKHKNRFSNIPNVKFKEKQIERLIEFSNQKFETSKPKTF